MTTKREEESSPRKRNHQKPRPDGYVRYTAMAFEMIAIIGLGTWGGTELDKHYELDTPWFTIGCALLSILLAMYLSLRNIIGKKP